MIQPERVHLLKKSDKDIGNVVYWMSRDQRIRDNWALLYARELARELNSELAVVFCLTDDYPDANIRHYDFMLEGLNEVSGNLQLINIPFYILKGDVVKNLSRFTEEHKLSHIVCDFDPLRIKRLWKENIMSEIDVTLIEVDAHNIVPARLVSNKLEYGANTFRPKILRRLTEFLVPFPSLEPQIKTERFKIQQIDWKAIHSGLKVDKNIKPVEWLHSGEEAAGDMLQYFIGEKLAEYATGRNDPNSDLLSNLSPYLHFGQISAQKVALEIKKTGRDDINTSVFLDELIVRRELAENYCFYNLHYDQLDNIPAWASSTLDSHKYDEREFIYSPEDFEKAQTHDDLWNAAQLEMVNTGKMHSYLRMYWAKKILEWSISPAEAFNIAIHLNDKYQLDGRDPSGYAGCAWAIGGVHDRAWNERPVYGKIRYMNRNGAKRKFNIKNYIEKWNSSIVHEGS